MDTSSSLWLATPEWLDLTTGSLGPVVSIPRRADEEAQQAFVRDLRELVEHHNMTPGPDILLESEYLEVVMTAPGPASG